MRYSIGEIAERLGISVRTLHYYDEIGLVNPTEISSAGYRYYHQEDLARLQQVLFYRELEFSLADIAKMLAQPDCDRRETLLRHRKLLELRRNQLEEHIALVDETLGGKQMQKKIHAGEELEETKRQYAREAARRWGTTSAYAESVEKETVRTPVEQRAVEQETEEIFRAFGACRGSAPDSPKVQALVRQWQDIITRNYYSCTKEILSCLGEMYVADERFTAHLDQYGAGTAELMHAAIALYCRQP